jgi:hypothetical protein
MHGTEQCIEKCRVFRRSAPPRPISLPQDQCLPAHRSRFPMEPVTRSGLSLARNGCSLSEASIPGSKVPTCYFATCQLVSPPGPPSTPLPPSGLPHSMARSTLQARCSSSRRFARLLPLPPLPSRTFTSLGIEAFNRFRRFAAHLPNPPDSSRSPPPVLSLGLAADHRSWLATFPEACCSSNLLEPSSLCPLSPFSVNAFSVIKRTISSTFMWFVSN